jgi:hypothetical protein
MVALTVVLGVLVVGLVVLVLVVPARTIRREGSTPAEDRARVLLGDADEPNGPPPR